ncbi:MAG: hypothetical protein HQK50_16325 [Oligoflexia bacterium]|nr:hypothetical protein [Oligoflexia bacterium]MBF0367143.1 hypothetical protein [Oligoflexia bacterium]
MLQVRHGELSTPLKLIIPAMIFPGAVTIMLTILFIRLFEDIKHYESDRRFFPEKPLPSGKITTKNLNTLIATISVLLFLINLKLKAAFFPFLVLFLFAFAMGKWFFIPHFMANNRIYTFLTHAPVVLLWNFYLIALAKAPYKVPLLTSEHFALAVWWAAPLWAWEIARKIRAPADEALPFHTYSRVLGADMAAAFIIFFFAVQLFSLFRLGAGLNLAPITIFLSMGSLAVVSLLIVRFMYRPTTKMANRLPLIVIAYTTLCTIILFTDFLMTKMR